MSNYPVNPVQFFIFVHPVILSNPVNPVHPVILSKHPVNPVQYAKLHIDLQQE